jgi:signal transduction histidine kinase/CheY-like chemotaxis protein
VTDERDPGIPTVDLDRIREEAAEFAGVGIYRYREDGTIVFMDRASLRLLDLEDRYPDPAAVVGRDIGTLLVRLDPPATVRRAVLAGGRVRDFEYHYRTLSGKERWAQHNSYLVRDPHTGETQIQVLAKDITAVKEAEARERERELRAEQARKMESLGTLAGGIAHDFNNLLAAVLGNAELARLELADPAAADRHLAGVIEAASQAAGLCRQLLAYTGRSRLDIRPLDLNEVVREGLALARLPAARLSRVAVEPARGALWFRGDAASIRQVLLNLVQNAFEALGDSNGGVRVSTGTAHCSPAQLSAMQGGRELAGGEYVSLVVADDGPGMDAATAGRIFEPFFSTKFTGRGLGLASVLGILGRLGGAVGLETAPGRGSRFTVLLPASATPPLVPAPPAPAPRARRWTGVVLLADDEPLVRKTLGGMLQALGFSVLPAADGREAAGVFEREGARVRLAVLDLTMPGLDGAAAAARIRELAPRLPILFSSGYDAREAGEGLGGAGRTGFLKKPYRMAELQAALGALLDDEGSDPPGP